MNYRTSTYVLLVLLIGYIIYSRTYMPAPKDDNASIADTTKTEQDMVAASPDALTDPELARMFPKTVNLETGEFIIKDSARKHAERYRNHRNVNQQLKKEPYGFGFGLNKIKRLLANIDAENNKYPAGDTNRIVGVRMFLVRKHTTGKPHMDMMIVPCRASGYNYISIGDPNVGVPPSAAAPPADPDLILNRSSPCPDMCDGSN